MQGTTLDLPAAVMGFAGVHVALRAEAARPARLVDAGADRRATPRAGLLARVLTAHHRTEDRLLWPALEQRQPGFAATTAEREDQHRTLDRLLAALPGDPATIDTAAPVLEQHLRAEEERA